MESFGALTGADLDNFERGGRGGGGGTKNFAAG